MEGFIDSIRTDKEVVSDLKTLIPDAGLRRRMSRIIKMAVSTAVECLGSVEEIDAIDAIVTATGWGCLADSERFLRNAITDKEQLLNPTPFIQSTFNTVGGQIALMRHNHCYNTTYVHRSHGFEDALLDALMRLADGDSRDVLVGAFDEQIPAQQQIMTRLGLFRKQQGGEGAVFVRLTDVQRSGSLAKVVRLEFPDGNLSPQDCMERYASSSRTRLLYNAYTAYGLYPTASAQTVAQAVRMVVAGAEEVVVYNEYLGGKPAVVLLQCLD